MDVTWVDGGTELLVYESSVAQRRILSSILSDADYRPTLVSSSEEALREIETGRYGVFISNLEHADVPGLELFWNLKANPNTKSIYTIAITASEGNRALIAALDSGADDFLRKPFDMAELKARLRVATRSVQMQQDLSRLALTDALTGIANRRAFLDQLNREIACSERTGRALCVAMVDIDHFKRVNDTYGHGTGDKVIRKTADRMVNHLRANDRVGRLGGEEFGIILPDTMPDDAMPALNRLREDIGASSMRTETDEALQVTVSMGLAVHRGMETADAVLSRADEALYEAKETGRNRVCLAF